MDDSVDRFPPVLGLAGAPKEAHTAAQMARERIDQEGAYYFNQELDQEFEHTRIMALIPET